MPTNKVISTIVHHDQLQHCHGNIFCLHGIAVSVVRSQAFWSTWSQTGCPPAWYTLTEPLHLVYHHVHCKITIYFEKVLPIQNLPCYQVSYSFSARECLFPHLQIKQSSYSYLLHLLRLAVCEILTPFSR